VAALESEISQAQRRIDEARRAVARQRQIIAKLRAGGAEAKAAQQLPSTMIATLETFEQDRLTLEDERFPTF
jgi:predicted  nucleic acid-binding Zn-ribbon protein